MTARRRPRPLSPEEGEAAPVCRVPGQQPRTTRAEAQEVEVPEKREPGLAAGAVALRRPMEEEEVDLQLYLILVVSNNP